MYARSEHRQLIANDLVGAPLIFQHLAHQVQLASKELLLGSLFTRLYMRLGGAASFVGGRHHLSTRFCNGLGALNGLLDL